MTTQFEDDAQASTADPATADAAGTPAVKMPLFPAPINLAPVLSPPADVPPAPQPGWGAMPFETPPVETSAAGDGDEALRAPQAQLASPVLPPAPVGPMSEVERDSVLQEFQELESLVSPDASRMVGEDDPESPSPMLPPPVLPSPVLLAEMPEEETAERRYEPPVPDVDDSAPVLPPSAAAPGLSVASREKDDDGDTLDDYLRQVIALGGSDLHLSPGSPPRVRVNGDLRPLPDAPMLSDETLKGMVNATLMSKHKTVFEQRHELNFSYQLAGEGRFRGNLMMRDGKYAAVYRLIPWKIKTLAELKMPERLADFAFLHRGLVLVTGATGSGKSTTLAALLDLANRSRDGHILTIEDPIEFVHQHRRCVVNQREVGPDTDSFAEALRNALRQDPDIILVGEMRDLETIQVALSAAETGHLVFGTLHTSSAKDTINRVIDAFPAGQQDQIRTQLASSLSAVLCQTLCRTIDGKGRVAATELMIPDVSIRTAIRESKIHQIPNAIVQGRRRGMHTLTMDLTELTKNDVIGAVEAAERCYDRKELANMLGIDAELADEDGFLRYQDSQLRRLSRAPFGSGLAT